MCLLKQCNPAFTAFAVGLMALPLSASPAPSRHRNIRRIQKQIRAEQADQTPWPFGSVLFTLSPFIEVNGTRYACSLLLHIQRDICTSVCYLNLHHRRVMCGKGGVRFSNLPLKIILSLRETKTLQDEKVG